MTIQPKDISVLEQARKRLILIQEGLDLMRTKLLAAQHANNENGPLPSWHDLQESAATFTRNMDLLQTTFAQNRDFLTSAHAYPHANFPATTPQGNHVLTELLRKKPEPEVEAWMKEYTDPAKLRKRDASGRGLGEKEQGELWAFAEPTSRGVVGEMEQMGAFGYDYTLAEHAEGVGRVRTGLRRGLNKRMEREDEEMEVDEVEGEGDVVEDVMPEPAAKPDALGEVNGLRPGGYAMRLDDVLKFVSAGVLPAGR